MKEHSRHKKNSDINDINDKNAYNLLLNADELIKNKVSAILNTRPDYRIITENIPPCSRILDLGCGSGELLWLLKILKNCEVTGIERDNKKIQESISKGISVIQGDLEELIYNYPEKHFDFCILSQTLHELTNPTNILIQMNKISKNSFIIINNLANIKFRSQIFFTGRFPRSSKLPFDWNNAKFIFMSIADFIRYCKTHNFLIKKSFFLMGRRKIRLLPNLLADRAIFKLTDIEEKDSLN